MSRVRELVAALGALATCVVAAAQFGIPPTSQKKPGSEIATAPPIKWVETYAEAEAQARRLGRPLFVFFHDNLKGARLLEVGTVNTPDVQKRAQLFVCVQFDPEKDAELARKLGIAMTQGILFIDAEGKVLGKLEGNPAPERIAGAMDQALKAFGPVPSDGDIAAFDKMLVGAKRSVQMRRINDALRALQKMIRTGAHCESVREAQALAAQLEAEGAKALQEIEALLGGAPSAAAISRLRTLAAEYAATETGAKARELLTKVQSGEAPVDPARVAQLWDGVQSARNRGRLDDEVDALDKILEGGTAEDKQKVEQRLAEINGDPELQARLTVQRQEQQARSLLARGRMWLRTSPERGKKMLEELIAQYPDTPQAEEARELLESAEK